jgi:ribulose-phosphate 3-epimerase
MRSTDDILWLTKLHPALLAADPLSLINVIHERKMLAGVAISPDTPSTDITDEVGNAADMLLVMTVYPGSLQILLRSMTRSCSLMMTCTGRGGQKFLERCVPKVAELRARFPDQNIEVDGGVGPSTIDVCAEAGQLDSAFPSEH